MYIITLVLKCGTQRESKYIEEYSSHLYFFTEYFTHFEFLLSVIVFLLFFKQLF